MRALLDTHTWVWWLFEPSRLRAQVRSIVEDDDSVCCFSVASAWEMAIKLQLGKLVLPVELEDVLSQLEAQNVRWLNISQAHCLRLRSLPLHHRDPFDRMLAAQAVEEKLSVLSGDRCFDFYGLHRVW